MSYFIICIIIIEGIYIIYTIDSEAHSLQNNTHLVTVCHFRQSGTSVLTLRLNIVMTSIFLNEREDHSMLVRLNIVMSSIFLNEREDHSMLVVQQ